MSRAASFLAFLIAAAGLSTALVAAMRVIWLEPGAVVPRVQNTYYASVFFVVLFVALILIATRRIARPLGVGLVTGLFFAVHHIVNDALTLLAGFWIFIAYLIAGTVGTALADGFIKGYDLPYRRGR